MVGLADEGIENWEKFDGGCWIDADRKYGCWEWFEDEKPLI